MNRIFEEASIPFRLASTGEERGRVVAFADEARDALIADVVGHADPTAVDTIAHAIALFRARGAGRPEKRSAVVALARIWKSAAQPSSWSS